VSRAACNVACHVSTNHCWSIKESQLRVAPRQQGQQPLDDFGLNEKNDRHQGVSLASITLPHYSSHILVRRAPPDHKFPHPASTRSSSSLTWRYELPSQSVPKRPQSETLGTEVEMMFLCDCARAMVRAGAW